MPSTYNAYCKNSITHYNKSNLNYKTFCIRIHATSAIWSKEFKP